MLEFGWIRCSAPALLAITATSATAQDSEGLLSIIRDLTTKVQTLEQRTSDLEVLLKDYRKELVAPGSIVAFGSETCPPGWRIADGSGGAPDLRGRFPLGAGRLPQSERLIVSGGAGGSHLMRMVVAFNEAGCCSGDKTIWGAGVDWLGEVQVRQHNDRGNETGGSPRWVEGEWKSHLPPYLGLLYCIKD